MAFWTVISIILQAAYAVTVVSLVLLIISENRNPQKTMSWILVLVFMPIAGTIAYLIFGEDHRRRRKLNKRLNKGLEEKPKPSFSHKSERTEPSHGKLERLMLETAGAPLIYGNRGDFFPEPKERFEKFFDDIKNAKGHIHLLYYTLMDDRVGNELKSILIKKAAEGVEVRVIYDGVGSLKARKKFFKEMAQNGVEVEEFLPIRFLKFARRVNYRNHRKIAVIDGEIGYVGGRNIADCYLYGLPRGEWRDLDIRIEGEGVYGLQAAFLTDWYYAHKQRVDDKKYFPKIGAKGANLMQIVSGGPNDEFESIMSGMFEAICGAKKYAYITTPYFIPNEQIMRAMQAAALSGVDVRLILPSKSDSVFVNAAGFSFVSGLLESGVKVYLFQGGFIHAKSIAVDDSLFITGSANMDIRSFELNFETCAFLYDEKSAEEGRKIFMGDLAKSKELLKDEWAKRPAYRRAFESSMRIISPIF